MNKKEIIKLFELNGFLAGYRDNHKRRMQLADSTEEYNLHKGAYLAYDNALTQLENIFGESKDGNTYKRADCNSYARTGNAD